MFKPKKIISLALSMLLILGSGFTVYGACAEEVDFSCVYTPVGNTGGKIVAREDCSVVSATLADSTLADISYDDSSVTVTAKDGALGIATVYIYYGGDQPYTVEVPLGYTTFCFNGDLLTVYEGAETNYSVTGINASNEEYTGLAYTTDELGGLQYSNTDTYTLCVSVKKSGGTYAFSGKSDDMCIAVKKEATAPAVLLLSSLELSSSFTSPITVRKDSTTTATITALSGHQNTLSDAEFNNGDIYGSTDGGGDGTNAEYAESSVIKGKDYSNITLNGKGRLNLVCATKNAIKVTEYGSLTIEDLTLNITSQGHGISADNTITFNSGFINVTAEGDGIRTAPDTVDSTVGCTGSITINGGTFIINSTADCIQVNQDLTIHDGIFNLQSMGGYSDSSYNADSMSCKGLKATYATDDTSSTSTADATNQLMIYGGIFNINTPDDAIHSDAYCKITDGLFTINTGDDAFHADTNGILGESGASSAPKMYIPNCYEGIESGTLTFNAGSYYIVSGDDGVNAAGDSSTSGFNPGGGNWGNGNSNRPGSSGSSSGSSGTTTTYDYNIYINGGDIYINSGGDGLDSNGALEISGGNVTVWGAKSGSADAPVDCDGSFTISGGTIFAAGSSQMTTSPNSQSQGYITSSSTFSQGTYISVYNSSTEYFSTPAVKSANYVLFSSPEMTSTGSWSIKSSSSSSSSSSTDYGACQNGHTYDIHLVSGEMTCTENGTAIALCSVCGDCYEYSLTCDGHAFDSEFTVDTPATESSEGSMSRHCLCCDEQCDITAIPALGSEDNSEEIIFGDIDSSGTIDSKDVNLLMRYIAGINYDISLENADIDESGIVDAKDYNLLKRKIAGL